MLRRFFLGWALLVLGTASAHTPAAVSAPDWQHLTQADVAAAYTLLRDNHPAAHPESSDLSFKNALDAAYVIAKKRAARVRTEGGHAATLRGFAVAIGDPHIYVRMLGSPQSPSWAGLSFRYSSGIFYVDHVKNETMTFLNGASLRDCDGVPAKQFAAARLGGFRAIWPLEAERVQSAHLLLIDEGNPFVKRPRHCRFHTQEGRTRTVQLIWQTLDNETSKALRRANTYRYGVTTMGLRIEDSVAWLAMPQMNEKADALIAQATSEREKLLAASAIIIDLRGNGGGSSRKGDLLVETLFGIPAAELGNDEEGDYHWRATPFVLETIQSYANDRAKIYGENAEEVREWREEAAAVQKAIHTGQAFAPPLKTPAKMQSTTLSKKAPHEEHPLARRVFMLTDSICVSSCLMLVGRLRALGVRQLGWETNASRRYMEVRAVTLPSARAEFSTLQKLDLAAPNWVGPYKPDFRPPAGIANAATLEAWTTTTAISLASK